MGIFLEYNLINEIDLAKEVPHQSLSTLRPLLKDLFLLILITII